MYIHTCYMRFTFFILSSAISTGFSETPSISSAITDPARSINVGTYIYNKYIIIQASVLLYHINIQC